MDPIWYFITFWIGRYLVDVHGWGLAKIGWFAIIPFMVADLGNILGGLFTQFIIKKGVPIPRARKIAVSIFGNFDGPIVDTRTIYYWFSSLSDYYS